MILKVCDSKLEWEDFDTWKSDVLKDAPARVEPKVSDKTSYKVVQINDMHIDLLYKEGSQINCKHLGNCCQEGKGTPTSDSDKAGYWGALSGEDGNCDIPTRTVQKSMEYIRDVIKPDYIIWLGDNSDHDVWKFDPEGHYKFTHTISDIIKEVFDESKIPIFPILGNHEM